MKTRVLYFPESNKKLSLYADILAAKLECKTDKIPPAYNCENEKLVVIGVKIGNDAPDALARFCKILNKTRAQNVAFFFDGPKNVVDELANNIREAGANVISPSFTCKTGGLPFLAKVSADEKKEILEWIDKILLEVK